MIKQVLKITPLSLYFPVLSAIGAGASSSDESDVSIQPTSSIPDARSSHSIAYDAKRKKVVLFGGLTNLEAVNDTWLWDGKSWKQVGDKRKSVSTIDGID